MAGVDGQRCLGRCCPGRWWHAAGHACNDALQRVGPKGSLSIGKRREGMPDFGRGRLRTRDGACCGASVRQGRAVEPAGPARTRSTSALPPIDRGPTGSASRKRRPSSTNRPRFHQPGAKVGAQVFQPRGSVSIWFCWAGSQSINTYRNGSCCVYASLEELGVLP